MQLLAQLLALSVASAIGLIVNESTTSLNQIIRHHELDLSISDAHLLEIDTPKVQVATADAAWDKAVESGRTCPCRAIRRQHCKRVLQELPRICGNCLEPLRQRSSRGAENMGLQRQCSIEQDNRGKTATLMPITRSRKPLTSLGWTLKYQRMVDPINAFASIITVVRISSARTMTHCLERGTSTTRSMERVQSKW